MEESRALAKLLDAADLVSMLEDLTQAGTLQRMSEGSIAGVRLTLQSVREHILSSHSTLASFIADTHVVSQAQAPQVTPALHANHEPIALTQPLGHSIERVVTNAPPPPPIQRPMMTRRDLRASLEKLMDRPS